MYITFNRKTDIMQNLPIGMQSFEAVRNANYLIERDFASSILNCFLL